MVTMIKTGHKFLEYYKNEINTIFGPSASGKTTFCMLAAIEALKESKKVFYFDTETSFNIDRFKQLQTNLFKNLNNLLIIKIKDLEDQSKKIKSLERIEPDLVIVDSLSYFYRLEIKEDYKKSNELMVEQLRALKHISGLCPIILTAQVYSLPEKKINMVGGNLLKNFSTVLIELQKDPRRLITIKPTSNSYSFNIHQEGIY